MSDSYDTNAAPNSAAADIATMRQLGVTTLIIAGAGTAHANEFQVTSKGDGEGSFAAAVNFPVGDSPWSATLGDFGVRPFES